MDEKLNAILNGARRIEHSLALLSGQYSALAVAHQNEEYLGLSCVLDLICDHARLVAETTDDVLSATCQAAGNGQ
ncbi:MAG: hypothetical protein FWD77_12290 [Betaproteobacteria bacterium]|nr:hypothetical protein [Betaproteobacteria bacterium]